MTDVPPGKVKFQSARLEIYSVFYYKRCNFLRFALFLQDDGDLIVQAAKCNYYNYKDYL